MDEEIEDDSSARKKDHGQLNKQKKTPFGCFGEPHEEGRKDRLAKP
jgi:hypothetical protein